MVMPHRRYVASTKDKFSMLVWLQMLTRWNLPVPSYGMAPIGDVYFVDPIGGAAAADGRTPATARDTIANGLLLCTADNGDVIVRLPGLERPGDVGLAMNVRGVTLLGVPPGNIFQPSGEPVAPLAMGPAYWRDVAMGGESATGPAVTITQPCRIIGMEFFADWTVAGSGQFSAAMLIDGDALAFSGGWNMIEMCRFPGATHVAGVCGVGVNLMGASQSIIKYCTFEECTEAGIMLDANVKECHDVYIEENNFWGNGNAGIDTEPTPATPEDIRIHRNKFSPTNSAAQTMGIRTRAAWLAGMITDNFFAYTRAGVLAIDQARAVLEGIGVYCAGNNYTDGMDPRA